MMKMSENKSSKILNLLSNPIRASIVKILFSEPQSFSELMNHLSLESTSKLSFHLEKLSELISKNNLGNYDLTDLGVRSYTLLKAFEKDELITPTINEDENIKTIKRNPVPLLLSIMGLLYIGTLILTMIFIAIPGFKVLTLLIPVLSFSAIILIGYKMHLPYDYTIMSAYINFLILYFLEITPGLSMGGLLSGAIFTQVYPNIIDSLSYMLINIVATIIVACAGKYYFSYFSIDWPNQNNYKDGNDTNLFIKIGKWQIWVLVAVIYIGILSVCSSLEYTIYTQYDETLITHGWGSESYFSRSFLPIYFHQIIPSWSIIIFTFGIWFISTKLTFRKELKIILGLILLLLTPIATLSSTISRYLSDPAMNVTRSVPLMSNIPEIFLISGIILCLIQLIFIFGISSLLSNYFEQGRRIFLKNS